MPTELMLEIAARKEAESNLRESEARYRMLFEANPLPLWVVDVETLRFLAVNNVACVKYGYTREEFLAMTLRDIRASEDIPRMEQMLRKAPPSDANAGLWRHRTKDRGIIDVEVFTHALTYGGRAARFACPMDVTERLRAEAAGRDAESRFRALVEQSIAGIYIVEKARITYANPKLCEIFGYSLEDMRTRDLTQLFSAGDLATVRDVLRRRKGGDREAFIFECRAVHADGHRLHLSVESKLVNIGSTEIAMGIVRDISPRVHAQAALLESELRFRQLAENINEVFFLEDPENAHALYVSPAYAEIWGRTCESLYADQASWTQAIHPDDRAAFLRSVEERRTTGHFDHVYRILRPDGTLRWIHSRGFPVRNESGALYRIAGVAEDITERKRAEDEVHDLTATLERRVAERTAALEAANLELESFDYSISHDLRSPLRHIAGFSGALFADWADKLDAPGREMLRRLNVAAGKMDRMVGDLLALSTLTRGEAHREEIDVSALATVVVDELRRAHPGREVQVVIEPSMRINADRGLLHIALENLLGNAWKFTSKRAGARIEVGKLVIDRIPVFFVRDNGAGFDMTYADKLFAPFRRLHRENEFEGTGIGLATVQRIVRLHQGRIWAEGAVDAGATFYFTLSPAGDAAP